MRHAPPTVIHIPPAIGSPPKTTRGDPSWATAASDTCVIRAAGGLQTGDGCVSFRSAVTQNGQALRLAINIDPVSMEGMACVMVTAEWEYKCSIRGVAPGDYDLEIVYEYGQGRTREVFTGPVSIY
jgi:hypothetical protein